MTQNSTEQSPVPMTLKTCIGLSALFVTFLWTIKIMEIIFNLNLIGLTLYPQDTSHLVGIAFAPLIHGSLVHLMTNTPPLLILGTTLLYGYPRSSPWVLLSIWLGSGLGVWLFAREVFHLGASGLTFGMMFFIFVIGIIRWDRFAIALAMIVFFLYGSMIWGIFPIQKGVSFETHFFGALFGILSAFILRHFDPPRLVKRYSWEEETDIDDEEPYWLEPAETDIRWHTETDTPSGETSQTITPATNQSTTPNTIPSTTPDNHSKP